LRPVVLNDDLVSFTLTITFIIFLSSGGMENIEHASLNKYKNGMVGCISDLILDTDYHVKLVQMSTAGKNIKHCG
jgi:hypothetical protein